MSKVLNGRVVYRSEDAPAPEQLTVTTDASTTPAVIGPDGRFTLPVTTDVSGPLTLHIKDESGTVADVVVDQDSVTGDLVVVLPQRPADPREDVQTVEKLLSRERAAGAAARTLLGHEVDAEEADDAKVHDAVNAVLMHVAHATGGDATWRVTPGAKVSDLTDDAVAAARSALDAGPPVVHAEPGALTAGQQLSTGDLAHTLSGIAASRDGYWRSDPLTRLRMRRDHQDPDGLPVPAFGGTSDDDGGPTSDDSSPASPIAATIEAKAGQLVDAIRLPEDPPLLVADSAITSTGPEVTLASGIADKGAFHDFHELVLAMPDVWQEIFDRRFVSVVEHVVRDLVTAGVDVTDLTSTDDSSAPSSPVERLLAKARRLDSLYATTSAAKIRPKARAMTRAPSAMGAGLVGSHDDLLGRLGTDDLFPGDGPTTPPKKPGPTHPIFEPRYPIVVAPDGLVATDGSRGTPSLLEELESYLRGKHSFTVFAAKGAQRATNFGVMLTWRQLWDPLSYQTGEIAHTMTLAPGEQRKVVTKRTRSVKRYTAEAENAHRSRSAETTDTTRAESEILRRATATTNFHVNAQGSTNVLVSDGSFATSTTRDTQRQGDDTRRRFREAVMKSAQELREERSIEVKTETEETFEEETTAEVRNPNDEIAMTAVFYTLQRRYSVHEHLHRARPVVLVAMPVPDPASITTAWLVRHAWIIRRHLLDDRFIPALEYLTSSFLGDSIVLADLKRSRDEHQKALVEANHRLAEARILLEARGTSLRELRERIANAKSGSALDAVLEEAGSIIPGVNLVRDAVNMFSGLFGGSNDAERRERAASLVEAAEEEFSRAERESREAETQVAAATSAFQQATREYVAAKRDARNHEVRIAELRVHVSDNIVHYMHGIWASQPPDQRFFELHNVQVPVLDETVQVTTENVASRPGVGGFTPEQFRVTFTGSGGPLTFRSLAEVADLDQLIGFKGNYAVFAMKRGNALTDLVLSPYLDNHEILRDPGDEAANWTLSQLREYADQLRDDLAAGRITQQEFDDHHAPFLRETLERLITDPRPSEEMIVVPTDSLYVELLTSGGSLIERFKKEHRAMDVAKVRAENRRDELDNLRRAARIGAGDLADPDMDDFERHLVRGDGGFTPPSG